MSRSEGFSLVEVLAALAVISIAGVALMNAVTQAGRSTVMARERALSQVAAENLMNQQILAIRPGLELRESSGRYEIAGRVYSWTLDIVETEDPQLRALVLRLVDESGAPTVLTTYKRSET